MKSKFKMGDFVLIKKNVMESFCERRKPTILEIKYIIQTPDGFMYSEFLEVGQTNEDDLIYLSEFETCLFGFISERLQESLKQIAKLRKLF